MNARLMLKIRSMLPILLLFSFSLPPLAFSADLTVVQRSGQVRHSLIVCSEGDVRSTGKKPSFPKKWRSLALQQAEASALSKARAFLEEKKRNHDNFDYKLSGSVRILNKKEAAPGEPGIRRMWIEAEVPYTPLIPQKKEPRQQESDRQVSEGTLNIQLWSDPGPFKNGKAATIYFQGSKDFYGRIVRIGSRNEVEQLLPNVYRQSSLFKKGVTYRIPDEGDRFQLSTNTTPGEERWVAYATPVPMGQINMKVIAGGRYQYRGKLKSFERSVRCGLCQPDSLPVEFYQACWDLEGK